MRRFATEQLFIGEQSLFLLNEATMLNIPINSLSIF